LLDFDCQTDKSGSVSFPCSDIFTKVQTDRTQELATYTTTLTLKDQDGYNGGLLNAGISLDWVVFGDHEIDKDVVQPRAGRRFKYQFAGYPVENPQIGESCSWDVIVTDFLLTYLVTSHPQSEGHCDERPRRFASSAQLHGSHDVRPDPWAMV